MPASKFFTQVAHSQRCHRPPSDDAAELAIIRQAIVTGQVTPLADTLCRKYYSEFIHRGTAPVAPFTAHLANRESL
jgi:hypothetical protein